MASPRWIYLRIHLSKAFTYVIICIIFKIDMKYRVHTGAPEQFANGS